MQIKELFTRSKHNEGVWVDVKNEKGVVVGRLRIRGLDSDAYRSAHDGFNREMVRLAAAVRNKADAELLAATQEEKDAAKLAERVALVAEWTFEDECNAANVTELFREAPYLSDQVFFIANERDRFLGSNSQLSTDGQNTSSDSTSPQQQEQITPSPTP